LGFGAFQGGKGIHHLLTAKNGDEREQAFYDLGGATSAIGLAPLGAKTSLKGINHFSAEEIGGMSAFKATLENVKAVPASIRESVQTVKTKLQPKTENPTPEVSAQTSPHPAGSVEEEVAATAASAEGEVTATAAAASEAQAAPTDTTSAPETAPDAVITAEANPAIADEAAAKGAAPQAEAAEPSATADIPEGAPPSEKVDPPPQRAAEPAAETQAETAETPALPEPEPAANPLSATADGAVPVAATPEAEAVSATSSEHLRPESIRDIDTLREQLPTLYEAFLRENNISLDFAKGFKAKAKELIEDGDTDSLAEFSLNPDGTLHLPEATDVPSEWFHGTSTGAAELIQQDGFRQSLVGRSESGKGVYLAPTREDILEYAAEAGEAQGSLPAAITAGIDPSQLKIAELEDGTSFRSLIEDILGRQGKTWKFIPQLSKQGVDEALAKQITGSDLVDYYMGKIFQDLGFDAVSTHSARAQTPYLVVFDPKKVQVKEIETLRDMGKAASPLEGLTPAEQQAAFMERMQTGNPAQQNEAVSLLESMDPSIQGAAFAEVMKTDNTILQAVAASKIGSWAPATQRAALAELIATGDPMTLRILATQLEAMDPSIQSEALAALKATNQPEVLSTLET
jgi:hypothetical protein